VAYCDISKCLSILLGGGTTLWRDVGDRGSNPDAGNSALSRWFSATTRIVQREENPFLNIFTPGSFPFSQSLRKCG
jgi:hypothetical protein